MDRLEHKTLGDALGMPTEEDKTLLRQLILRYEKEHPGEIKQYRDYARDELSIGGTWNGRQEFGVTGKQAHMRWMFNLPPGLAAEIERRLPTLFREKKHFHWFVKHFKEMLVPERN